MFCSFRTVCHLMCMSYTILVMSAHNFPTFANLITKKSQKHPEKYPKNPPKQNPKNLQKSPIHISGNMCQNYINILNDLKRKNNWYFLAGFNFKHFILFQYYFWSNYWGVRYANFQYKTPTKENLLFYLIWVDREMFRNDRRHTRAHLCLKGGQGVPKGKKNLS